MTRDRRYRIALEWCGYAKPRLVIRFCGEWVGQAQAREGAKLIQDARTAERLALFAFFASGLMIGAQF